MNSENNTFHVKDCAEAAALVEKLLEPKEISFIRKHDGCADNWESYSTYYYHVARRHHKPATELHETFRENVLYRIDIEPTRENDIPEWNLILIDDYQTKLEGVRARKAACKKLQDTIEKLRDAVSSDSNLSVDEFNAVADLVSDCITKLNDFKK